VVTIYTTRFTSENCEFYLRNAFMCFVDSENKKWLFLSTALTDVFTMEMQRVFFAVGTEILNI
jgi:hypothetical protein